MPNTDMMCRPSFTLIFVTCICYFDMSVSNHIDSDFFNKEILNDVPNGSDSAAWDSEYMVQLYNRVERIQDKRSIKGLRIDAIKPVNSYYVTIGASLKMLYHLTYALNTKLLNISTGQAELVFDSTGSIANVQLMSRVTLCWNKNCLKDAIYLTKSLNALSIDVTDIFNKLKRQLIIQHLKSPFTYITLEFGCYKCDNVDKMPLILHSLSRNKYEELLPSVDEYSTDMYDVAERDVNPKFKRNAQNKQSITYDKAAQNNHQLAKRDTDQLLNTNEGCNVHDWIFNLEILGLSGVIIQPKTFKGDICKGGCQNTDNMSYQAFLRKQYHDKNLFSKGEIPYPTCIPTETDSINMLLRNKDGSMTHKVMDNAIALKCGCA